MPGSCKSLKLHACCTGALLERAETDVLISKVNSLKPSLRGTNNCLARLDFVYSKHLFSYQSKVAALQIVCCASECFMSCSCVLHAISCIHIQTKQNEQCGSCDSTYTRIESVRTTTPDHRKITVLPLPLLLSAQQLKITPSVKSHPM